PGFSPPQITKQSEEIKQETQDVIDRPRAVKEVEDRGVVRQQESPRQRYLDRRRQPLEENEGDDQVEQHDAQADGPEGQGIESEPTEEAPVNEATDRPVGAACDGDDRAQDVP